MAFSASPIASSHLQSNAKLDMSKIGLDFELDIADNLPAMVEESYKTAFREGIDEYYHLAARREALNKELDETEDRMERVRQGVVGLAPLAGVDFEELRATYPDIFENVPDPRIGITDAVREAMSSSPITLSTSQIRDRVFRISPSVAGHKSPMASIHAVLRRLIESGEIVVVTDTVEGTTKYGWVPDDKDEAITRLKIYLLDSPRAVAEAWKNICSKRRRKE